MVTARSRASTGAGRDRATVPALRHRDLGRPAPIACSENQSHARSRGDDLGRSAVIVVLGSWSISSPRARALPRLLAKTSSEALEGRCAALRLRPCGPPAAVLVGPRRAVALSAIRGRTRPPHCGSGCSSAIAGWRLGRRTIDNLTDTAPRRAPPPRSRPPPAARVPAAWWRSSGGARWPPGRRHGGVVDLDVGVSRNAAARPSRRHQGNRFAPGGCAPNSPRPRATVNIEPAVRSTTRLCWSACDGGIARNRAPSRSITSTRAGDPVAGLSVVARSRGRRQTSASAAPHDVADGLEPGKCATSSAPDVEGRDPYRAAAGQRTSAGPRRAARAGSPPVNRRSSRPPAPPRSGFVRDVPRRAGARDPTKARS